MGGTVSKIGKIKFRIKSRCCTAIVEDGESKPKAVESKRKSTRSTHADKANRAAPQKD